MMKQFDHMIERKLNLELSNVFPRLSNVFPRLKFLAGCGQFSDFGNKMLSTFVIFFHLRVDVDVGQAELLSQIIQSALLSS
jgi:hypothetical protein